MQLKYTSIYIW